ncbi:hypothetical protein ACHAQA_006423 [Verticillium albo-atrum]
MDPVFEDASLKNAPPLTLMSDAEREFLLCMSPMDQIGWAPESFRDGPWGTAKDPKHPWRHDDVPAFLGKLGFGSVYTMPDILDAKQAKELADSWRYEVWAAYFDVAPHFRRNGDMILQVLADENALPEHELSDMISESWDQVRNSELEPLFGRSSAADNSHEGYRDYRHHWRGTVRHDCKVDAEEKSGQKADRISWTRPLLDVKAKEPTLYNEFVARNVLALTIPWLHTKHLLNRHTLWKLIMNRCNLRPYYFSRADWLASHLAHSTHLVASPYRDAWFMGFPDLSLSKKYFRSIAEHFGVKFLELNGKQEWHGFDIVDPSPEQLQLPVIEAMRERGILFGWSQGILLLQCQSAILRFLGELVSRLIEKWRLLPTQPSRVLKPLRPDDPFANDEERQGPRPQPEEGLDHVNDLRGRFRSLLQLESLHLRKFDTDKMGWHTWDNPDYRPPPTTPRHRAVAWREYSISICKSLAELRHDPIIFQAYFAGVMDTHPGCVPESEAAASSWIAKRNNKKKKKAKKKRGSTGNAPGTQASSSALNDDDRSEAEDTPEDGTTDPESFRVLGHITSTDIEAKKSLVNDVLRRGIRGMVYRLEISNAIHSLFQNLADVTKKEAAKNNTTYKELESPLPGPESYSAWTALLVHLRRFAEILKSMVVDDGVLHSSPWVRQNFRRDISNGEWESRASVGQTKVTPWALPRTFVPFDTVRFTRKIGLLQRDEQALFDDLELLTHGDGAAAGFVGMWRLIHAVADNVEDMSERGYFDSPYTQDLLSTLHHVMRWSRLLETIRPLRIDSRTYETTLKDSKHLLFFSTMDDFQFEAYVTPSNLRDVQWLLGVRYADDDRPPMTISESRQCLGPFWKEIDSWLEHGRPVAHAYVDGLSRLRNPEKHLTIEEQKQAIREGKNDAATIAARDARQFVVTQICGHISTLKPRPAAPAVTEAAPPAPAVIAAARESIEQSNKRWIIERFGGGGGTAPGRSQLPKNTNHEEHEAYRAKVRTRLTQSDWVTVERTFGNSTGSVRWQDWCRLVTHMGFQMQPQGGSIFKFTYTSASRLPNGRGTPGWSDHTITHMQHGTGSAALLPHVARGYATRFEVSFNVTRDVIAAAYGTEADPDPLDGAEDVAEESDGERKRNRKRKRRKEKFQKWLQALPLPDVNELGQVQEQEVPMAGLLDDSIDGGELDVGALNINALLARLGALKGKASFWSSARKRVHDEEEEQAREKSDQDDDEYDSSVEEEHPTKRVRFS